MSPKQQLRRSDDITSLLTSAKLVRLIIERICQWKMRTVAVLNVICIVRLFLAFSNSARTTYAQGDSELTAATRFKRTDTATVMRAILAWQDWQKQKTKLQQTWAHSRRLDSLCQSGVCVRKNEMGRTPHCCLADASPVRRQRERTIQGAHVGTTTHSDTLRVASVLHSGRLIPPKMDKV